MGDITKIRKKYEILEIKEIEDFPPGWRFKINDKEWNFEELANWGDRAHLAYWFSVVFWRSRFVLTNSTRKAYWHAYKSFWLFLESEGLKISEPEEIKTEIISKFKNWLNSKKLSQKHNNRKAGVDQLAYGSKRHIFSYIRQTIKKLISINLANNEINFTNSAFLNSNLNSEKSIPYSQSERSRIVDACNKEFALIESGLITKHKQIYVPYLLTLALRTGINLQPLLDLTVESIKPSLIDGRLEITVKKNRGYSSQNISFDVDDTSDEVAFVSKRVESLFRNLIKINEKLKINASEDIAGSLWLMSSDRGEVKVINSEEVWKSIQEFRDTYNLKDDSGNPLKLNIRRMRPTFAQAILRINGGDLRDLQRRLNHKNINTTMGYLDANQEDFKTSFRFRGIIMQHALGGGSAESLSSQIQCSVEEAQRLISGNNGMTVGTCRDPLSSPFKNKGDISPCTKFMSCFRCHNQVITSEDAHKIYSFYWFLLDKKNLMPQRAWEQGYEWIIRTIEHDISPNLGETDEMERVKYEALINPYPAWPNSRKGNG